MRCITKDNKKQFRKMRFLLSPSLWRTLRKGKKKAICIIFFSFIRNFNLFGLITLRDDICKNSYSLSGKFWFIHHIYQILHLQNSIYFSCYKVLLMKNISNPWKIVKGIWKSSLLKKIQSFGKMEFQEVVWKMAGGSRTIQWAHCSMKFLIKMKILSFIFT